MKTTVREQRDILKMVKAEIAKGSGIKSIEALLRGYGNPDNVFIDGTKIGVRVSHDFTYLRANDGY